LDEPNASFNQPPGHQAFSPKIIALLGGVDFLGPGFCGLIDAVRLEDVFRFAGNIQGLRRRQLHAGRQFITPDARIQPGVLGARRGVFPIQSRH
jgi:hypothetical protein